jgi:hypothetical protein
MERRLIPRHFGKSRWQVATVPADIPIFRANLAVKMLKFIEKAA